MLRRTVPAIVLCTSALALTAGRSPIAQSAPDVAVHEWGTFTTVAGDDGQAINWLPLGGPSDLPCFVNHFKTPLYKVGLPLEGDGPLDYESARSSLVGTVRMETPVLYFYSPTRTSVSVSVRFPRGLMTEWYPAAGVSQPAVIPKTLDNPNIVGSISWPDVQIVPTQGPEVPSFPTEERASHYYAARATDATPVRVNGQDEKFLFYRGVASFPAPIAAVQDANGSIRVTNQAGAPIPSVILFENRAGRISYRNAGGLKTSDTIARPSAAADMASLRADFVSTLTRAGLFPKEAEAMVDTWRDSWFEEGTRVFYVLPQNFVDAALPLSIAPAPKSVVRAFVGRVEVITPDAILSAQTALAQNDMAALERQGRFLGPIIDKLVARTSSTSDRLRLRAVADRAFAAYTARLGTCR